MDNMRDIHSKKTMSIFITVILMKLMGMWYVSNKKEKIIADVLLGIVVASVIFSFIVQTNEFYHARSSFRLICSVAPTFCSLSSELIKLFVFCKNRKRVMQLNEYMYENFWNAEYNKEETVMFNKCNNWCIKALICYVILLQIIVVHLTIAPYLEPRDNTTSREIELPFPIYINYPINETPVYEILFILEVFGLQGVVLCLLAFPIFLLVTNMFMAVQFKMLNLRMQSLCKFPKNKNGNVNFLLEMHAYDKLKDLISQHQILIHCVNEMENLYSYAMLGQIFASISQLSSTSVTILLSKEGGESINKAVVRFEILVASLMQFYFYTYSSHAILTESEKISEGVYSSDWFHITHPWYQKHFSLLTQIVSVRAQRPCILTVGKCCPLTLITFTSVMKFSMSFFTVMRQTIE